MTRGILELFQTTNRLIQLTYLLVVDVVFFSTSQEIMAEKSICKMTDFVLS